MTAGKPLDGVRRVHRVMSGNGRRRRPIGAALVALAIAAVSCTGVGAARRTFHPALRWAPCPSDVEIQYFSRHRCG
jgi:hypothetical protein